MTYILTFTNNTDRYTQELQLKNLSEELHNDCKIQRLNEEISLSMIDKCVENAVMSKYDNFMILCEEEDIDLLEEGLNEEYGHLFEKISVVKEEFYRLTEDNQQQINQQQIKNNKQNMNNSQPNSIKHLNLFMVDVNYPFGKQFIELLNIVQSNCNKQPQDKKFATGQIKNGLIWLGAIPGQQFLSWKDVKEVAVKIPNAGIGDRFTNLEKLLTEKDWVCLDKNNIQKITEVLSAIKIKYQSLETINLFTPKGFTTLQSSQFQNLIIYNNPILPTYDFKMNQQVFEALKKLVEGKKNQYKNMKSSSSDKVEKALKDESKNYKDKKEYIKGIEKDWYAAEIQTGYPAFIDYLVTLTEKFLKDGEDKQTPNQEQVEKSKNAIKKWLSDVTAEDRKNWTAMFNMMGPFSQLVGLVKAIKDSVKMNKNLKKRLKKNQIQAAKEREIRSDAYYIVREAFAKSVNDNSTEQIKQAIEEQYKNEQILNVIISKEEQAQENVKQIE